METKNYYKMGAWKRGFVRFTGIVALSFAVMISCQKKESSNNSNYIAPLPINQAGLIAGCAGCNFAQAALAQNAVSKGSSLTIAWNLVGDQAALQQVISYGYSVKMYSGPVMALGTMSVATTIPLGGTYYGGYGCQIPAGQYQLNTLQVGNMSQGSFTIPQLEAVSGGTRIIFTFTNAVVMDPTASGTISGIAGQLTPVAMVNGAQQIPCSDIGFYLSGY